MTISYKIVGGMISAIKIEAALTGTEKQVAWAEDIRHSAITKIAAVAARFAATANKNIEDVLDMPQGTTNLRSVLIHLAGKSDAKWWIENRHTTEHQMICAAARDIMA